MGFTFKWGRKRFEAKLKGEKLKENTRVVELTGTWKKR
jgi:hypothetical protein